ncbi:MAG: AsmA-like C-terminal region-containing protein [Acidobacteriaceae bacterium]|nr:AsmA-like C-terminal region-containing protein [Acidobacteriaceae bacterium]
MSLTAAPKSDVAPHARHRWLLWLGVPAVVLLTGALAGARWLSTHAEPLVRARLVEALSDRFNSRVEISSIQVSVVKGLLITGRGIKIFGKDADPSQAGVEPLLSIDSLRFHTTFHSLFHSPLRVESIHLEGVVLNVPPKEQRASRVPSADHSPAKSGRIATTIGQIVLDDTKLIIHTLKPGKLPLVFAISRVVLSPSGSNRQMRFEATLTNPKPVGNIFTSGRFGPFDAQSPRDTPIEGEYSFRNADLSTIKGIGGILSSNGRYSGTLGSIAVDGATDTPDFRLSGGRGLPLHTDFHAIVDGTTGDTYLQPVKAKLLNSTIVTQGYVVREMLTPTQQGRRIKLDVTVANGRIEDFLKLGQRSGAPFITGSLDLKTKFDLSPGSGEMWKRLQLISSFRISSAHFTNGKIQDKLDSLSQRTQGKMREARDSTPGNVFSVLDGDFVLRDGVMNFSRLQFQVPGTQVDLVGAYTFDGSRMDFHGKARMDARLSQMVTGWKSVLLKPADPFFAKDDAGTEVPVRIAGTKSEPQFALDFGHKSSEK